MALATEEEEALIEENPAANVICRCELVTEGEILSAIHRLIGSDDIGWRQTPHQSRNGLPDARRDSVPRRHWKSCRENCISIGTDH